jgi:Ribbon-helix-helix protein, copG family
MKNKVKVSFNLLEEDLKVLKELSERRGSTVTEVLRRAIAIEKVLSDEVENGNNILIGDSQNVVKKQLVLR